VLPGSSIIIPSLARSPDSFSLTITALPTIFVWFVIWYLVATIAEEVRLRDRDLDAANKRLIMADEEINQQMLRVTHDLKAPFAGIESNIQVLKTQHWDETPESVRTIINKIDARSAALRSRIGDILMLGSLRSPPPCAPIEEDISLQRLIGSICQEMHSLAAERSITFRTTGTAVDITGNPKQLKILFANLIANAVTYSHKGGTVDIDIQQSDESARVRIADHGIGIGEKALPYIFEDFYRTPEAVSFNSNSTGLGLAIVRQIVRNLRLAITVKSEAGKGTVFEVSIPRRPPQ